MALTLEAKTNYRVIPAKAGILKSLASSRYKIPDYVWKTV